MTYYGYNPKPADYTLEQLGREIARVGKGKWDEENKRLTCHTSAMTAAKRRLKAKGIARPGCSFSDHLKGTNTPWGKVQEVYTLIEGEIHFVSTPGHGGLWINQDRRKQLPKWYKSYTGTNTWHEEDEDSAIVLQIFGLLSLVDEPLEVEVTQEDIDNGRETRVDWRKRPIGSEYFDGGHTGGPIQTAFQRITGTTEDIINTEHCIQAVPGCWKYSNTPKDVIEWIKAFDKGEPVAPITFTIEPYIKYHHSIPAGTIGYKDPEQLKIAW